MICHAAVVASLLSFSALSLIPGGPGQPGGSREPRIFYDFTPMMQVGFEALDKKNQKFRLTFSPRGTTNLTVLQISDQISDRTVVFGDDREGKWAVKQEPLESVKGGGKRLGRRSVWVCQDLHVTQIVEVVDSDQGKLDTCLVTYKVENKSADNKVYKVGVRPMLDTLIGDNDGNSFEIPDEAKLVVTSADFEKREKVPTWVKALQIPDKSNPGLSAYLTLKVGRGLDAPNRFIITTLPVDPQKWLITVRDMRDDAAVAIYWDPVEVAAGKHRTVGYGYGLGKIADKK